MTETANIHRTEAGSLTDVLPKDVRGGLDALRAKQGANTAIGHRCSNILAIDQNYRESTDPDHRVRLIASMAQQTEELKQLLC